MSKVTMQDIADTIGVSRITVWKALTDRPGVSEEIRRQILRKAEEVGYRSSAARENKSGQEQTVSVVVSRPESSSFWMQIIHHIAKELALSGINLMYTYMPSSYKSGYMLPPSLSQESISGFIVLNIYDEKLLRMLAAHPLPKVFLDTVPGVSSAELGGDLVLLEGRSCVRDITGKLLESGRQTLGFIGDVDYAQTNQDRYLGFLDAHRLHGLEPSPAYSWTKPIHLRSHYEEISQFLNGLTILPDAFVCASDFIAHFVQRYLGESGRKVPEDFVLTGFDNNSEYQNVAERITTVDVQTSSLGKRLANKVMFRVDHPSVSPEVSYVLSNVLYRSPLK